MALSSADARQDVLRAVERAIDALGLAVAALGEAYGALDEQTADRLEEQLFRPVQGAYGRAQRTHAAFAERYALPKGSFASPSPGAPSLGSKGFLEVALQAVQDADDVLADLQDSFLPVEFGDEDLRAGLSAVRRLIGDVPARGRQLLRTLGR